MTSLFQKRISPPSIFSILIVLFYFSSCTEYKETPSAYQYEVHFDAEGETPKVGDKVIFHEKTFLNGKEMFSTYAFAKKEIILPVKENLTKPLPPNYEALFTMSPGDSLTVWQPLAGMENLPEGYQEKDMVSYVLKLVSVIPATQLLAEKKK